MLKTHHMTQTRGTLFPGRIVVDHGHHPGDIFLRRRSGWEREQQKSTSLAGLMSSAKWLCSVTVYTYAGLLAQSVMRHQCPKQPHGLNRTFSQNHIKSERLTIGQSYCQSAPAHPIHTCTHCVCDLQLQQRFPQSHCPTAISSTISP